MTNYERLQEFLYDGITFLVIGAISGMGWLFRQVFTNQAQIKQLEREINARDKRRDQDHETLTEIGKDVRELRQHIFRGRQ